MKNPRLQISLSSLFFSQIFSATKRTLKASSLWLKQSLSPSPNKLFTLLSLPPLSTTIHKPNNNFDHFTLSRLADPKSPPSKDMEASVRAVEEIIGYQFKNKRLLEEALTHPSCAKSRSYQRLEFVGGAALKCAFTDYFFVRYPGVDPGQLSILRACNVSTERLARVAVKNGLFGCVRYNAADVDEKVREFALAVQHEDDGVTYGGLVKAPKILADIVQSVAAAVYVDCDCDTKKLWLIFKVLLEPIVTLEDL